MRYRRDDESQRASSRHRLSHDRLSARAVPAAMKAFGEIAALLKEAMPRKCRRGAGWLIVDGRATRCLGRATACCIPPAEDGGRFSANIDDDKKMLKTPRLFEIRPSSTCRLCFHARPAKAGQDYELSRQRHILAERARRRSPAVKHDGRRIVPRLRRAATPTPRPEALRWALRRVTRAS